MKIKETYDAMNALIVDEKKAREDLERETAVLQQVVDRTTATI